MYLGAFRLPASVVNVPLPEEFRFARGFNLVCGEHGSGKTQVLRLAAAAAAQMLSLLPEDPDVQAELAQWHMEGAGAAVDVHWEAGALGEASETSLSSHLAAELRKKLEEGQAELPVLAFYGAAARVGDDWREPAASPAESSDLPQFGAYLDVGVSPAHLETVVNGRLRVLTESLPDPAALLQCLEERLVAGLPPDAAQLVLPLRMRIAWDALPGGVRRMLAMVLDLATRCVQLNPHLGGRAPAGTSGVVLIEAIETQLHPRWQRRVLEDLRRAFPLVQFVATTYSPFVIQAVGDGKVLDMDGHREQEYAHISIEDITETVLGVAVPQRSKRYLDMNAAAAEVFRVCAAASTASEAEKDSARARMDELTMPFSTNQAFMALLAMEREEAGLGSVDREANRDGGDEPA